LTAQNCTHRKQPIYLGGHEPFTIERLAVFIGANISLISRLLFREKFVGVELPLNLAGLLLFG
jgi:hypothetical protein